MSFWPKSPDPATPAVPKCPCGATLHYHCGHSRKDIWAKRCGWMKCDACNHFGIPDKKWVKRDASRYE